jgi:cytochrome c peroxidase
MKWERLLALSALLLACGVTLARGAQRARTAEIVDDLPKDTLPSELPAHPPVGLEDLELDRPEASAEQVALGRRLFFDPILSVDRTVSCASCHRPDHGFADPRPLSVGVRGQLTTRNAPTLLNRGLGTAFMWDGSAPTLEEQVLGPIENPLEMDLSLDDAIARLTADAGYREAFLGAFGAPPGRVDLSRALTAFVSRLWIGASPFDRFRVGEIGAFTSAERAGFWLYESRGGCWRCHTGANFTDESFHNTGVGVVDGTPEEGRAAVTGEEIDRGGFKTPTLRGLASTGPYMHDGSLASLEEVVEFYRRGGNANAHLDPVLKPIEFTDQDAANLVAFLRALSRQVEPSDPVEAAANSEDEDR